MTYVIEENGDLIKEYRTLEEKMHRIVLFWFLSIVTASLSYWMPTNAEEKERQQDVSRSVSSHLYMCTNPTLT